MIAPNLKQKPVLDPTKPQRKASDPGVSAWVGASAGSGKTTVLVNRVLRLLLAGAKPHRILGLTYTRAAAAEMAIRIGAALGNWATCSDDELRQSLDELQGHTPTPAQLIAARRLFALVLECPGGMRLRTIHAFSQEVLRRFPIEAGLPPHFAVIEEEDARALTEEVKTDLLRGIAKQPQSPLAGALDLLVQELGAKGFDEAMRAVLSARGHFETTPKDLSTIIRGFFDLAPDDSEEKFRLEAIKSLPRADILRAAKALAAGGKTCAKMGAVILQWLELPEEAHAANFDDYANEFFTTNGEIRARLADKKTLAIEPDADDILRREAVRLLHVRERTEALRMTALTLAVSRIGGEFTVRYKQRKAAQAALDYDDLILRTESLLRRPGIAPWVLYKLDGGLDHILVDEAQDTSRAQWRIIAALAEEFFAGAEKTDRTLFVVGDEKQSIFSFQNADPDAFAAMRQIFAEKIGAIGQELENVPLHMSFRSAPAILHAVDAVFAAPAAQAGVSAEPVEHLPAPRKQGEPEKLGRVELWKLIPPAPKTKPEAEWALPLEYETERDPPAELAAMIAARISNWIAKKEMLPGLGRAIAAGDIMILLRRRGRFADLMVRALKQAGVPVTGVDRMHLIEQLPVMDLLALVQFALLPEDDLNLASVLRGPLLGAGEEQLMQLAITRKGSLWQSLKDHADTENSFAPMRDYLEEILAGADFSTPYAMLSRLLGLPCPAASSGKRALWARLGADALDPIDELLNAAQVFSRRHTSSLQSFLHWLTETEAEIKRELDKGVGQVRIMTVHASKGLEAPIVFLPDTANIPRAQELPKLLWDEAGMPLYLQRRPRSGKARTIWEEARRKQMEEYRRLFYVALTRAANRLYIGGWQGNSGEGESAGQSWHALAEAGLRKLHQPSAALDAETKIAFADPQFSEEPAPQATAPQAKKNALPAWAFAAAPEEPPELTSVAPSRIAALEPGTASPDKFFARGRIIHRLLQSLPDLADEKRDAAAARYLANPQHNLPKEAQAEIAGEVLSLLRHPDFEPLFGPGSKAEVPVVGRIGGKLIAGQIDRLCVRENDVWIVDYKSNRPPPARAEDVAPAYRAQLAAYRAVLQKIYPQKTIFCFLLWTYAPRLMDIPARLLTDI